MTRGLLAPGVVQVVGGHQRQPELSCQPQQVLTDPTLDGEAVVHELAEVVVRPEDVSIVSGGTDGLVVATEPQLRGDLAAGAARGGDDAGGVLRQQLPVHPGLVEVTLQRGPARQPEQVVHPGRRLGQQGHVGVSAPTRDVVVPPVSPLHSSPLEPARPRSDVRLHADDRLDPGVAGSPVELVRPEHVAVVGHGQGRHAHAGRLTEEVADPGGAVEHGVLAVDVQVHERVAARHRGLASCSSRTCAGGEVRASLRGPRMPSGSDTRRTAQPQATSPPPPSGADRLRIRPRAVQVCATRGVTGN